MIKGALAKLALIVIIHVSSDLVSGFFASRIYRVHAQEALLLYVYESSGRVEGKRRALLCTPLLLMTADAGDCESLVTLRKIRSIKTAVLYIKSIYEIKVPPSLSAPPRVCIIRF